MHSTEQHSEFNYNKLERWEGEVNILKSEFCDEILNRKGWNVYQNAVVKRLNVLNKKTSRL